ncbi:enoyl-CoA hydratase/isomerase family protein [Sphingomonas abietis]|uniref:Enoyl-CoA hydratase-related protein n=1 Tax=Sphingomonas abietis TaxID=3012344 RepID=A0ABY7NIX5_9SPHN|nr:enoyl-CoA hydratase-related protein [Sphingomonas abietis]WBO21474.1 enoyl-CoA hydratase-related protein [Sphingomonas abietis]
MFRLEMDRPVARIVIDRGEKRNAIPIGCWSELERIAAAAAASDARLVVITSADPASFCAGADLSEMPALIEDVKKRHIFRGAMTSALARIRGMGKPTMATIEGGCFGAGVSLAMACDMRVAGPNATFAITPARFGISYPQPDLMRLIELVGPGQAARLLYTAETIDAAEAHRIGLVELLCGDGVCGKSIVDSIAGNAPYSLYALKATMAGRFGVEKRFDDAFSSADFQEGWEAFSSRRKPDFVG